MSSQPISSDGKLRAAAKRLLAGKPTITNGALTKENLYKEAGVSRATMNRAREFLAEWERDVSMQLIDNGRALKPGDPTWIIRAELSESRRTITDLRNDLLAAKTIIAMLHEDNRVLRDRARSRENPQNNQNNRSTTPVSQPGALRIVPKL